jgi:hypothetical protein
VCCGLLPAAYPLALTYAGEVRAYSMEFTGIILGCVLLDRLIERPDSDRALLVGGVFAFFLGSRYGFAIFAAAAIVAFACATLRSGDASRREATARIASFAAPIALVGVLIFVFALLPQHRMRLTYGGGALVRYLAATTAAGKSPGEIAMMLVRNLLGPAGLPLTLAALLGLALLMPRRWRDRLHIGRPPGPTEAFCVLSLSVLLLTALLWRWHPWDMGEKWSLWMHALAAVALVRFGAALLDRAGSPAASGIERPTWLAALTLGCILALSTRLATFRAHEQSFVPALSHLERVAPAPGRVAVEPHPLPMIRYFYEYGPLTGSRVYPAAFRFANLSNPEAAVDPDTKYVLSIRTLDGVRAAYPERVIAYDPSLPRFLYRFEAGIIPAAFAR